MKTIDILSKDLHENLLVSPIITGDPKKNKSLAFDVSFIEEVTLRTGKLLLRTREYLQYEGIKKSIMTFAGHIIMEDETCRPCIGYYLINADVHKYAVIIIEPE